MQVTSVTVQKRKDTCTPIFTIALFTMAKTWKQSKCPLTDGLIKMSTIYHITVSLSLTHTPEHYSAIKKNKIMPLAATLMDLEIIMLSEEVREEQISYDISYIWNLKK